MENKIINLVELAANELNISAEMLTLNNKFRELPNWSSLNALLFVAKINEETGILISSADLADMITLSDIHHYLIKKLA